MNRRGQRKVVPGFLGGKMTPELSAALPHLAEISSSISRGVIRLVVDHIKGADYTPEQMLQMSESLGVELEAFGVMFTGVLVIMRLAIRERAKEPEIKELVALGISAELVNDLCRVMSSSRTALEASASEGRHRCERLESLRWRVDVAISTSDLSRCLSPSITMEMRTSDGRIRSFDVPIDKFHELRHNTAKVLRGMQGLEAHPVTRIISTIDKAERLAVRKAESSA